MKDKEITDISVESAAIFLAQDAVDNIARIKNASWRVMAVQAAVFAFLFSQAGGKGIDHWFYHISFCATWLFFLIVVIAVYPSKISNYRNRYQRFLGLIPKQAKYIHESPESVYKNDVGDKVYIAFSVVYFLIILIGYFVKFFDLFGGLNS